MTRGGKRGTDGEEAGNANGRGSGRPRARSRDGGREAGVDGRVRLGRVDRGGGSG